MPAGQWDQLSAPEFDDLVRLSFRQFRDIHGLGYHTWAKLRRRFSLEQAPALAPNVLASDIPVAIPPSLPTLLEIRDERIALTSDWHAPHHSVECVANLIRICGERHFPILALIGDTLNGESYWMGGIEKGPNILSFDQELEKVAELIDYLLRYFERIYWLRGNHEDRLFRANKWELGMKHLLALLGGDRDGRIVVTDRDHMMVRGPEPRYDWRLTHGVGGSASVATSAAVNKAEIHQVNVAQGHNHLMGIRQTKTGQHWGMDIGCMLEPRWEAYKELNTKPYPRWMAGFALLEAGRPTLYSPSLTTGWTPTTR